MSLETQGRETFFFSVIYIMVIYIYIYDGHSDQCEMITDCGFDLHFSND